MYTVQIDLYDNSDNNVTRAEFYKSEHRTAKAASRRLAELINRRTERAKDVHRRMPVGWSGMYVIVLEDGARYALTPFRHTFLANR